MSDTTHSFSQHSSAVKTRQDFHHSVTLTSLSPKIRQEMNGSSKISSLICTEAQTESIFRMCLHYGASKLTHIGERSLAGGKVERTSGRGQLRWTIALCHAHYGVGVTPAWFTSFTLWQTCAIASERRDIMFTSKEWSTTVTKMNECRDFTVTYSKPFFGKVFLSGCRLQRRE